MIQRDLFQGCRDSSNSANQFVITFTKWRKNYWPISIDKKGIQRRQWHPTPVLLPGKSHGWRSLEDCSPWGCWGSDTTEQLHFHLSLSCIGERNGNPLQCSCLENPRDGGAWWAAIYGVAQSRTRLKLLSSSSNSCFVVSELPVSSWVSSDFILLSLGHAAGFLQISRRC